MQVNSLWPSDVVWRQGSRSTLAQVMACCLTAPSHYLNQCWLMISEVLWYSPDSNFAENTKQICDMIFNGWYCYMCIFLIFLLMKPITQPQSSAVANQHNRWPRTNQHCCHCMMTSSNGNIFRITGPLCREFTSHRWIPLTKASDVELWCFLWSAPE